MDLATFSKDHTVDNLADRTGEAGNTTVLNLTLLAGPAPPGGTGWRCAANGAANKLSVKAICPAQTRPGHVLTIEVAVPPNSDAVTKVPLLGADPASITVTEGGAAVWRDGAFVPGVKGVVGVAAESEADVVAVSHGSGRYRFTRTDK